MSAAKEKESESNLPPPVHKSTGVKMVETAAKSAAGEGREVRELGDDWQRRVG